MMAKVAYGLGIMVLARVLVLKNLEVQIIGLECRCYRTGVAVCRV